jgi:HPt (histidine-containing phosphotransfer) domain-containing protein
MREARDLVIIVDSDLRALVPQFLRNKRADIANTIGALERDDYNTAARLGHQLKGEGSAFGFDEVTEMGAKLENAATSADQCTALRWARALADFLDNVEVRFND